LLEVITGTDVGRMREPLRTFLKQQHGRSELALFNSAEAPNDLKGESLAQLVHLLELGLFSAMYEPNGLGVHIQAIGTGVVSPLGFGTLLRSTLESNAEKLAEAQPREGHLAVTLDRGDFSTDPADTPPPELPEGIDQLWVLLGYFNAKWTHRVWRTTRADPRWQLLRHPVGEPPAYHPPQ
jgi:hypothetical protein